MSSANDVIVDTINSEHISFSTEAEAAKPKKMPKTKKKFGHGVIRGSNKKQGRGNANDRQAPTDAATTTFARGHVPSVTGNQPVKYITKAQLSKCLTTSEVRTLPLFFQHISDLCLTVSISICDVIEQTQVSREECRDCPQEVITCLRSMQGNRNGGPGAEKRCI